MKYLDWLAWCEAMRSFDFKDDDEYIAEQEKAIKHFSIVVENATDEKIKTSSVQGIVQYLCIRGRHGEAKKYAELYPENLSVSKDRVLLDCLQGNEKIVHYQKMLANMMIDILNHMSYYNNSIEVCNAQEQIIQTLIPDGNYLFYHGFLADIYRMKAKWLTRDGKENEAVEMLKISLEHATAYDKFIKENTIYHYTSPFFNQIEYNTENMIKSGTTTQVEDFFEYIKRNPFDKLHGREDFKQLFNI